MSEPCNCRYSKMFPHRKNKCSLRKHNKKSETDNNDVQIAATESNQTKIVENETDNKSEIKIDNKIENKKKDGDDSDALIVLGAITGAAAVAAVGIGIAVGTAIRGNNKHNKKNKNKTKQQDSNITEVNNFYAVQILNQYHNIISRYHLLCLIILI